MNASFAKNKMVVGGLPLSAAKGDSVARFADPRL
jgi:hypothetical protein